MNNAAEKKSKFSRLLGKRDKTPERPTTLPDSAYASSDNPSGDSANRVTPEIIPADKQSEIGHIDQDKNLAIKPSTGEVIDRDTGEIVTVVTTTTTTTTTTTRKGGQQNQDVKKEVQREVQNEAPVASGGVSGVSEMPATHTPRPSEPAVTSTTTPAPVNTGASIQPGDPLPPLPTRSAKRESRTSSEYPMDAGAGPYETPISPISPNRTNFSYPSRTPPPPGMGAHSGLTTADQPMHHNPSTIQDLKAAAKGIHGVGETLRGTLSSTIDRRFPSHKPEKAAQINAHNDQILAKGRTEMEGLTQRRANVGPAVDQEHLDHASTEHDYPEQGFVDQQYPGHESHVEEPDRPGVINKLFKRKPVSAQNRQMY